MVTTSYLHPIPSPILGEGEGGILQLQCGIYLGHFLSFTVSELLYSSPYLELLEVV